MVKKRIAVNKDHKSSTGTLMAVVLILLAGFLSSQVYEAPELPAPIIGSNILSGAVTAGTITSLCADSSNIAFKVSGNTGALAKIYSDTTYTNAVCVTSDSGHTCDSTKSNALIRIGNDGTVEKAGYTGPAASNEPKTLSFNSTQKMEVHSCFADRTDNTKKYGNSQSGSFDIQDPAALRCNPTPCGPGMTSLGYMDDYNEHNRYFNRFEICVEANNIVGEVVNCKYVENQPKCNLPACTSGKGTLQFSLEELHKNPNGGANERIIYGLCSNAVIKQKQCVEGDNFKTRICGVDVSDIPGYKLIDWASTYSGNWRDGQASFQDRYVDQPGDPNFNPTYFYNDFYINPNPAYVAPTPRTYTDACFGSASYHYDDDGNGVCDYGNCLFTIDADTAGKVSDCDNNPYAITACTGGVCTGTSDQPNCNTAGCGTKDSCNSNTNCAWDDFANNGAGVCKSRSAGGICNQGGTNLCPPILASCLSIDFTEACCGLGSIGFWNPVEVY